MYTVYHEIFITINELTYNSLYSWYSFFFFLLQNTKLCHLLGNDTKLTMIEPEQRNDINDILIKQINNESAASFMCTTFDSLFIIHNQILLQQASIFVGLHSDQATEAIVDYALLSGRPFAVVPCCVFPKLFPTRRLVSGQKGECFSNLCFDYNGTIKYLYTHSYVYIYIYI